MFRPPLTPPKINVPWEGTMKKGNESSSNHQFSGDIYWVSSLHLFAMSAKNCLYHNLFGWNETQKKCHWKLGSNWVFQGFTLKNCWWKFLKLSNCFVKKNGKFNWMLNSQIPTHPRLAINAHPARKSEAMLVDNNSNRLGGWAAQFLWHLRDHWSLQQWDDYFRQNSNVTASLKLITGYTT